MDGVNDDVVDRKLILANAVSASPAPFPSSGLAVEPLFSEEMMTVVAPGSKQAAD